MRRFFAVEMSLSEISLLVSESGTLESTLLDADGRVLAGNSQQWIDAALIEPLLGKTAAFEYERDETMYRGVIQPVPYTS